MSQFSVVVITRDRQEQLRECLESLQRLESPGALAATVVIDDGSTDSTWAYLAEVQDGLGLTCVHHETARGPAASRNHGVDLVTTPMVWFLDDDVTPLPQALRAFADHCERHDMARASAVGPVEQIDDRRTAFEYWLFNGGSQFIQCYVKDPLDGGEEQFCTANLLVPTELVRQERFDESFRYPRYEDRELGYRLARRHGHRIHLVPEARVVHLKRYRFREWLRCQAIFSRCAVHFARLYPADRELWRKLHLERAERTPEFSWVGLELAARALEHSQGSDLEREGPFGAEFYRDTVFGAFRTLQEFFRLGFLREELGLPEMLDQSHAQPLLARLARERLLNLVAEDA